MKRNQKVFWIICFLLNPLLILAQQFQMTIKPGSLANSVKATVKPGLSIDGKFSSAQITFIVSTSVGNRPSISIVNNFIAGMSYVLYESVETLSDDIYYVWEFDGIGSAAVPLLNFIANTEVDLLEVQFTGGLIAPFQVRVAQIPNGGINGTAPGNYNFYLALSGNDVVNQVAPFYGTVFNNDGLGYSGYSYAALNGIALPVKFLQFTAMATTSHASLTWQVSGESAQTDHYDIERSTDGVNFSHLNSLPATQQQSTIGHYRYNDFSFKSTLSNMLYYRIIQVDRNGAKTFSTIEKIDLEKQEPFISVYPNPIVNFATLSLNLHEAQLIHFTVTDALGKNYFTKNYSCSIGNNSINIPFTHMASGVYLLKVTTSAGTSTVTLIKK